MKLPVDIKEVMNEAVNIDAARQTPLSVSVIIDGTAPADITAHVRALFASAASHARITVSYLDGADFTPSADDDAAVLVAGVDRRVGADAAKIREAGVPVMVATTLGYQVSLLAEETGYPIPEGDLISPDLTEEAQSQAQEAFEAFFGKIVAPDAIDLSIEEDKPAYFLSGSATGENNAGTALEVLRNKVVATRVESLRQKAKGLDLGKFLKRSSAEEEAKPSMPNLLSEDAKRAFNNRMGEWIIETCREKRLSFALAFPFVARPLSLEAVNATAVQNAGIGVVVFLPGADMPVMTLNQAKMILQIAAAYGQPMTIDRAKELLAVVGGALAARTVARSAAGLVPGLGWLFKGAVGYTATLAMGRAAIEYFENGAGLMGATGAVVSAKNAALRLVSGALGETAPAPLTPEERNKQAAQAAKNAMGTAAAIAQSAAKAAGPLGQQLMKGAKQSFAAGIKSMLK